MKAIVFFEGKEVCQVECDRHDQFGNEITFYLNDVIVGSFSDGYCFSIYPEATHEQKTNAYKLGKFYGSVAYPGQNFKHVIYVSGDKTFK